LLVHATGNAHFQQYPFFDAAVQQQLHFLLFLLAKSGKSLWVLREALLAVLLLRLHLLLLGMAVAVAVIVVMVVVVVVVLLLLEMAVEVRVAEAVAVVVLLLELMTLQAQLSDMPLVAVMAES
jgi:hypothetical protein